MMGCGGQQTQNAAASKVVAQQSFQRRMDVQECVVQTVGQSGRLGGEIGVVAGQNAELDGGLLLRPDPAKGVRQRACGISDDVRVAGIGLRFAGIDVRDPPHREAGQVGHGDSAGARDSDRQCADRSQLIDHHEDSSVALEVLEQFDQVGLGIGERTIEKPLSVQVQCDSVMGLASDIDAAEHFVVSAGWSRPAARLRQLESLSRHEQTSLGRKRRQPRYG